jgi:hypothetical protein
MLTVITPTTGKKSLDLAIMSLKNQKSNIPIRHIILWDNKREGEYLFPDETGNVKDPMSLNCTEGNYSATNIIMNENFVQGSAAGSALRAIGLMAASADFVTFMDDDVMWDTTHVDSIMKAMKGHHWGFCKRRVWTNKDDAYECLGIDEFESMGEDAKTPYKMVDNNCMFFERRWGVSAACLYRNTTEYNDDRLMYDFMVKHAGTPCKTNEATINQVCPEKLIKHFRDNCTQEKE